MRRPAKSRARGVPVVVNAVDPDVVVVETRARECAVGEEKAERLHEMEPAAGVCAQAQHVARVRRDLGLVEDDVEHAGIRRAGISVQGQVRATTQFSTRAAPARFSVRGQLREARARGHDVVDTASVRPGARPRRTRTRRARSPRARRAAGRSAARVAHAPREPAARRETGGRARGDARSPAPG